MDLVPEQIIHDLTQLFVQPGPLAVDQTLVAHLQRSCDALEAGNFDFSDTGLNANKEKLWALREVASKLGQIPEIDEKQSPILYGLYNLFSRITYLLCYRRNLATDSASAEGLQHLKQKRYFFLGESSRSHTREGLSKFWGSLATDARNVHPEKRLYSNYTVAEGGALENQFHLNRLPDEFLDDVRRYLVNTDLANILEGYFKSKVGVCNVRSWRYVHAESAHVGAHYDRITPLFLKAMIFCGEITPDDGCFEFLENGSWKQAVGDCPVLVCDTDFLRHRALAPKPNRHRDAIELTIIPRIQDDLLVVHGGYAAGYPKNPFKQWNR